MSGGFFRGTSADQDTRFSNKQAKLMKSQKFPPELEHLVDISKVKMDVIKPWIATRVTELLGGFEDEVLINFIYGLLEGKEINGKAIQIQLTGFMEKNTSKFMKELWALLLSAEKNASGVPQQFLDAKEEETKKKKAESDRIFTEIQRRKEKELDQEKEKISDGGRGRNSVDESKRTRERGSDTHSGDENGADVRNGFRERKRSPKSSHPGRSPSPSRGPRSRSISKSYSNSRSRSKERSVSRSVSPMPRKHSVSPARMHRVPRRSVSPRRPSVRQSISPRPRSQSRRRSPSRTRYRSPSPMRRRVRSPVRRSPFPVRRRSPSPFRRRSRSPLRRRSPPRHRRSPSPWRRRSPSHRRRRSPSPVRQWRRRSTSSPRSQSPVKRRSQSPLRRRYRSPVRRRSPYSARRRSPSLDRRGSPSPRRRGSPSVVIRRSPPPSRRSPVRVSRRSLTRSPSRSLSPDSRSSASPSRQTSALPVKMRTPRRRSSLDGSPIERTRVNDRAEPTKMARRQSMAMSPQRDHSDSNRSRRKVPSVSPSPAKSPSYSPQNRDRSTGEKRRLASPYKSPKREGERVRPDGSLSPPAETKVQRVSHGSPGASEDELQIARAEERIKHKSTERTDWSPESKNEESSDKPFNRRRDTIVSRQDGTETPGAKKVHASKGQSHGSSVSKEGAAIHPTDSSQLEVKRNSLSNDDRVNSRSDVLVGTHKRRRSPSVSSDSGSEGSGKPKSEVVEKKKHKRSSRRDAASDSSSSDSEIEDRKEAKRRKKEARKLRKEDRRQRREERHRRREEKRASKRKRRSKNADALSSDVEKKEKNGKTSNGDKTKKYSSEEEETESQKKRLEIELREKALESLRAKKGISR